MDLGRTGFYLSSGLCLLIVSNSLVHLNLEARSIFLIRGMGMLLFFVYVMYHSPIIFKPFSTEGEGVLPFIWGIVGIAGGIVIARAALVLEFRGGGSAEDLISLTFFYFVSTILLAQPIARILKKGRRISSRDRLEKGVWDFDYYDKWLKNDDNRIIDDRGEIIAKRLRDNVLYIIDSDKEIGSSGNKKTHDRGRWLLLEITGFSMRNREHLPKRLIGKDNTDKFSVTALSDYITREVEVEFENRLLINVADGSEAFRGAREGNAHLARNLISQVGLHDDFRDQRIGSENGEEILKRQMAIFLHVFSEVFGSKVGRGDTKRSMGMDEAKMMVRGLIKHLIEKNGEITDESEGIWEKYPRLLWASSPIIGEETSKDINDLLEKMPLLDLGISRLDHSIDSDGSMEDDGLLSSFVSGCLDFFQEGTSNQEV